MANQIEKSKTYPRHPEYIKMLDQFELWRNTLNGGNDFIEKYLEQYNTREDAVDFKFRTSMTVNPAFAEGAVTDIKNAIFQRFTEIRRLGGGKSYRTAIDGMQGGVDNFGRTMNSFIGDKVLVELIGMGRVGIYIDMPVLDGNTLAATKNASPYLYIYKCEDITNVEYDAFGNLLYVTLLKKKYTHNDEGLIDGEVIVEVKVTPSQIIENDVVSENKLGMVPMVILDLNHGILREIAKYQIALMNISSTDINYLIQANFPLYIEQFNQNTQMQKFMKKDKSTNEAGDTSDNVKGAKVGVRHGRTYPLGAEAPAYINPSSEPLIASIKKQDQMKEELRQIVALSVSTMRAKMESAESKKADTEGLESGLAAVGTVLEAGERLIAAIWAKYVGDKDEVRISYPERYEIKDIDKTLSRCEKMLKMIPSIPVLEAQKAMMDKVVALLLSHTLDEDSMAILIEKINELGIVAIDPELLNADIEAGVISKELVAQIRHYPKDDRDKADAEQLKKIEATAKAQSKDGEVRGVPATKDGKGVAVEDKKDKKQRGKQATKTQGEENAY